MLLLELFDSKLKLEKFNDREFEKFIKMSAPANISKLTLYRTEVNDQKLVVFELFMNDAWEVHIVNVTKGFPNSFRMNVGLGAKYLPVIKAVADLCKSRLDKGDKVKISAQNDAIKKIYERIFNSMNKDQKYQLKDSSIKGWGNEFYVERV
jgi:hypothetical protein